MEFQTIKKRFFSSIKECAWLNSLGQKGYSLVARTENSYTFAMKQHAVYYSVEWLDCSPECEESLAYIDSKNKDGIELAATYSLWAYFVSQQPISLARDAQTKIANRYRNAAIWLCVANLISAILTGYQLSIRPFLEANSVVPKAPVLETSENIILQLAYRLWYGAEKILYYYTRICSNIFGDTKAALALGILVPLCIVLSVLCALWIGEWIKNIPPKENTGKEDELHVCQESETSGKTENDC